MRTNAGRLRRRHTTMRKNAGRLRRRLGAMWENAGRLRRRLGGDADERWEGGRQRRPARGVHRRESGGLRDWAFAGQPQTLADIVVTRPALKRTRRTALRRRNALRGA